MHTAQNKAIARTVSITTLGCKANQYDSAAIEDALRQASIEVVPFPAQADTYIINTCTVTGKTDCQSRQLIRKVRRLNPEATVIVTGCYAQVSPDEAGSIEGVDYVIGNPEKGKVVEFILKGRQSRPSIIVGCYEDGTPLSLRARNSGGRTRAYLKIQEGCNRACSYCIIPKARGLSKSLKINEVLGEIEALVEAGFKEIILTGIHLGAYGLDLFPASDLTGLLEMIEARAYPCRFRISSIDPDEVTEGLIDLLKGSKAICNHLHLPLQSGDDIIIRRMKRPYTGEMFARKVESIAAKVPQASIGVDVIAGFPGEGEKEFENTFSLLRDLPISYLHIFPFSKRRGTDAALYAGQVPARIVKERCERLKTLDALKRESFYRGFVGSRAFVLVEGARDRKTGLLKGRARNYIPVVFEGGDELKNSLAEVSLKGFNKEYMTGEV